MKNRILSMCSLFLFVGCNEPNKDEDVAMEATPTGAEDAEGEVTDPAEEDSDGDTDGGASGEARTMGDGPVGTWDACAGTLTRTVDSFSWVGVEPEPFTCRLSGASSFEDGIVLFAPDNFDSCESPPWWVSIFADEHPTFVPSAHETRLAMLPTVPNDGARIFNLEERLDTKIWALTDQAGNESEFRLCFTPDGSFFDGKYITLNESTDFLSYGGSVAQIVQSTDEEHWVTRCAGGCPCGGVVTIEAQSGNTISGRYNAANCARPFDGTFTGILTE